MVATLRFGGVMMTFRLQKWVCFGLLLWVTAVPVFAAGNPLRFLIKPTSETVKTFRFQTGFLPNNAWTEVDISIPVLALEDFDGSKDKLYIQQSEDHSNWSDSYTYQYDATANVWSLSLADVEKAGPIDSLDMKLYGLYPYGKSATYYSYVLGAGLKMNFSLGNQEKLIVYGEASYSIGPSTTDWVDTMQAINLSVGMGYRILLGDKVKLTPELGYGVLFHLLDADLDQDGVHTFEVFNDQQVRLSVNLSYALEDRYELFLSPLGVLFFENRHIGIMFGCQSGLRFNF